jgi:hypothetical protein
MQLLPPAQVVEPIPLRETPACRGRRPSGAASGERVLTALYYSLLRLDQSLPNCELQESDTVVNAAFGYDAAPVARRGSELHFRRVPAQTPWSGLLAREALNSFARSELYRGCRTGEFWTSPDAGL